VIDFELVVPDGWVQIPTTPDTARLRRRVIDQLIHHHLPDTLPRDKAGPWRRILRRELTDATDEAARQGARSVLLPLREFNGLRLPGSMVMTVLDDSDDPQDPQRLLASVVADAGEHGLTLEIDGAPAARIASIVDSGNIGRTAPSRQVDYYISNPEVPGVWGLITFTVLSDGDVTAEPVEAVVLLFDTIVATLRWANRVDAPTEAEVMAQLDELVTTRPAGRHRAAPGPHATPRPRR
jgi:hypothetical protein